ncbi:MAG: hypothetical protein ILP10_08405 [Lachnospiraceae bacterium]|nr:hypothetical protein [Lachnospiraceae bacterium]
MFNRRYRNEYKIVTDEATGKEKIIYIGSYYRFELSEEGKKARTRLYIILLVMILLLFAGGALINNVGSRIMYVMVPYAIAVFPVAYLTMGVVRTALERGDMEHIAYDCTVTRIRKSTVGIMAFMGISFAGDMVLIIGNSELVDMTRELLFAATTLMIGGLCFYFRKQNLKYKCVPVENKRLQENEKHN